MHVFFILFALAINAGNLAVFVALQRRLRDAFPRRGWQLAIAIGVIYWLLLSPHVAFAVGGFPALLAYRDSAPIPFAIATMAFQGAVWAYGFILLLAALPRWIGRKIRTVRRLITGESKGTRPEAELVDTERREVLRRAALTVPVALVATAGLGAVAGRQQPIVTRIKLPVRPDYTGLRGLTMAQFSDVHISSYMDVDRLNVLRDAVNALRPDLVVCTGDLIDSDSDLEEAQRLFRELKPRIGNFMCMGNHEYYAARNVGEEAIVSALREYGTTLLVDEAIRLDVAGSHLWLVGTDYPKSRNINMGKQRTTGQNLDHALAEVRDDDAPVVVLSHHPKTFYEGQKRKLDLMLSGHTHGGQIRLGRIGELNFSPVLPFELYHYGEYEADGRRLYVNSGFGSWMPVRVNCPPEITLIEFV